MELAPVRDAGSTVAVVAGALEVQRRPERSLLDSVVDVLGPRTLLLVLDNCEHLIDEVAPLAHHLLERCPAVRVLATSREPLGLPGEITWTLSPLAVPATPDDPMGAVRASPAVELFAARARAARPPRIHRRRGQPAGGRRDLHPARRRGADPRHRTLVDVVTWSYDLLTAPEQLLYARLSVFAGGFDLARVEVAALLATLVDKSMVIAAETAGRMRYRLLETLRAFAGSRLGGGSEAESVRLAHVRSYVATLRAAERGGLAQRAVAPCAATARMADTAATGESADDGLLTHA